MVVRPERSKIEHQIDKHRHNIKQQIQRPVHFRKQEPEYQADHKAPYCSQRAGKPGKVGAAQIIFSDIHGNIAEERAVGDEENKHRE